MKKQKRLKKTGLVSILEDARDAVLEKAVTIVVIILFVAVLFFLAKAFLYKSDYFRLRTVEAKGVSVDQRISSSITGQLSNLYRGRNVFSINLKNIAQSVQNTYPDAKDITVRIALPDRIIVDMKFRKAVALVKDERLYPIDGEGFILPAVDQASAQALPVIEGVRIKYEDRRTRRSVSRNLQVALELLKAIKESRFIAKYGLANIDAADLKNLLFYLSCGTEIRIGPDNFKEKIKTLEKTLRDPRLMIDKIKYIDLRFNDVVIGPK